MPGRPDSRPDETPSEMFEVVPRDAPSENALVSELLQKMPSLVSRGLVYLVVLLLGTSFPHALHGKIDVVVECRAVARPVSHEIRVLADRTGYLESVSI